jgi:hypothetical protein
MNHTDLQVLQAQHGYPAISIMLPTHRTSPNNLQDPIRVKNLVNTAGKQLAAQLPQREAEPVLSRLEALVDDIDYRYVSEGLALFANADFAAKFQLPFAVKERVVIGETFAIRDLVFALNRSPRYWVLVLSAQSTRLYAATRDTLEEYVQGGFPMRREGPGATTPLPGGFGVRKAAYADERQRQFFRQVDAAMHPPLAGDPLPLIVAGITRYLAFYQEVSQHAQYLTATLAGNHDKTPVHKLARQAWPLMQAYLAGRREIALQALEGAVSARQYASGIDEVGRMAQDGRGAVLLVEEGFHPPVQVDHQDGSLLAVEASASEPAEDAVDTIVETVLKMHGQVVFVDDGRLEKHQRIALIVRY